MDTIYLDYNCFQRSFDDHTQIKIQLEDLACKEIFKKTENKELMLIWSFMHEDENIFCPFMERKLEVFRLSTLCKIRIGPIDEIYNFAKKIQHKSNLLSKDAIHLACAHYAKSKFFITCDDELINRAKILELDIKIINPVEYIKEVKK